MPSTAKSVEEYLASIPADRREAISKVRQVILRNLPAGYQEGINLGAISYHVPLAVLPKTYNGQPLTYIALASQKNFMTLYLMNVYGHKPTEQWFKKAFQAAGKKLDMGKSCVHFRKVDDLPLDVIGQAVARTAMDAYVRAYHESRARTKAGAESRAKMKGKARGRAAKA